MVNVRGSLILWDYVLFIVVQQLYIKQTE